MRRTGNFLPLLLLLISVDELCTNFIFNTFDNLGRYWESAFYFGFLVIQIVAAPIQSGFSDFYLRKKSLIVSLIFSALGLFLTVFYVENMIIPLCFLALAVIIKGVMGNTLPIAWAGMADTQINNFRFSFGLSTAAIALGYLGLLFLMKFFSESKNIFIILVMILVSLYLCKALFYDTKDSDAAKRKEPLTYSKFAELVKRELKLIYDRFLGVSLVRNGLMTFFFWELSFYAPHVLDIDLGLKQFKYIALSMILGYLSGVIFVRVALMKKSDSQLIKSGFILSILSILPIVIFSHSVSEIRYLMMPCYFVYSAGAAFLVPSLFSILLKKHQPHEQGKLCGLMDSTDTFAFLAAVIFAFVYKNINLNQVYVAYFSLIIFVISVYAYYRFAKLNKQNA
ncbi:MAG TPA: MFS transporter [Rhabdochlamydiaceae bacterium]|nr:MFS transporter [Rhabdochlamydiaceae bacterium]